MVDRIHPGAETHLYIEEHMDAKGLSFEDMGGRLNCSRTTVWRWANEQWRLNPSKIAAIAYALGLDSPTDLYRLPHRPSIDAYMDGSPDDVYEAVLDLARRLNKKAS